jgi:hypothetical protein
MITGDNIDVNTMRSRNTTSLSFSCTLVRKDMDVNERKRLSNIALRHTLK